MNWHTRDSIALTELIFYIPFALLSVFVCYRHGLNRSSGWIYTLVLCITRTIGSICHFVSNHDQSPSLLKTILLLDSVGLSPLLLATLGLLSRFVDLININSTPTFTTRHFRIIQLVLFAGVVLAIVGGSRNVSVNASGTSRIPTTSKIAVTMYIIGFVGMNIILFLSVKDVSNVPSKERRVPLAITLAMPLTFVRLIYSLLSVFLRNHMFSIATGSVSVRLAMSLVEEIVIVALYTLLGLFVDKLDATVEGPIATRLGGGKKRNRNREGDFSLLKGVAKWRDWDMSFGGPLGA